jgi:hypothetical protein
MEEQPRVIEPRSERCFSFALEELKGGRRAFRRAWAETRQYVFRVSAGRYPPSTKAGERIAETQHDHKVPYAPYYAIKNANNEVIPWTPNQADLEACDWVVF